MKFTYKADELKWVIADDADADADYGTYNSKAPKRNMADVFSLDGKKGSKNQ